MVELKNGATVHSLYIRLKMPIHLRLICFCNVNNEPANWKTVLQEGDVVSFVFPISGG